ncbi:MAG TPA: Ig-like domain-containing protein [Candidatus Coprenecus stercoravium]|uniref:Ig-like domain-containing protein n=1 Tax=Candidatus Coprenecus stercoravium TaxID=2840735 RepID=A0A9D2GRR1_9BACT|nr:Ig-like domain-containing protein [Candidatus Coprenecus stercoravium]
MSFHSCERVDPENPDNPGTDTIINGNDTIITSGEDTVIHEPNPGVEKIVIESSSSTIRLYEGETEQLEAEVTADEDAEYTLHWRSTDTEVATVSEGLVKAVAAGKAKIIAYVSDVADTVDVVVMSEEIPESDDPRVGDFFYSDGSWASRLDSDKEVIGIVYWVGDPTSTDPTLRKEHPGCTHGLVCAITEVRTPWQSKQANYVDGSGYANYVGTWILENTDYEGPFADATNSAAFDGKYFPHLNYTIGYNNTKGLEEFNRQPRNREQWPLEVVSACQDYREKYPTPRNTSDWYIPSIKEMAMMISEELGYSKIDYGDGSNAKYPLPDEGTFNAINSSLMSVPNAELMGENGIDASTEYYGMTIEFKLSSYITSTEVTAGAHSVWAVGYSDQSIVGSELGTSKKSSVNGLVRFIFAF